MTKNKSKEMPAFRPYIEANMQMSGGKAEKGLDLALVPRESVPK